jgi:hypothetical protein
MTGISHEKACDIPFLRFPQEISWNSSTVCYLGIISNLKHLQKKGLTYLAGSRARTCTWQVCSWLHTPKHSFSVYKYGRTWDTSHRRTHIGAWFLELLGVKMKHCLLSAWWTPCTLVQEILVIQTPPLLVSRQDCGVLSENKCLDVISHRNL